ncbi:MAG TPA: hypothetical protein VK781_06050 [Solirubrobacteraceae bacterium]|nr:hypothetical protein [Solirubrobacteraceae bacterium]
MPGASEAHAWWADVEDVRERIERRRARESQARTGTQGASAHVVRRGEREIRPGRRLMLVETAAPSASASRRRPRPRPIQRVGPRPDRIAAWAVVLGFLLVVVAMLSVHV